MSKSTLASLSFGGLDEAIPDAILQLFVGYENTKVNGEYVYDYAEEIMDAAFDGRIRLENFNIIGYVSTLQNVKLMNKDKKAKHFTYFKLAGTEDDDVDGVSEDKVFDNRDDDYAKYDDHDEVRCAVEKLMAMREDYIIDYDVDIALLIKKSVLGFPQAVEMIKTLCHEDGKIAELVSILLSSGFDINELLPDELLAPKADNYDADVYKDDFDSDNFTCKDTDDAVEVDDVEVSLSSADVKDDDVEVSLSSADVEDDDDVEVSLSSDDNKKSVSDSDASISSNHGVSNSVTPISSYKPSIKDAEDNPPRFHGFTSFHAISEGVYVAY